MKSKTPSKKRRKRLGRGPGSTKGKTAGKGHKGQKSRSGYKSRPHAEGGQNTLIRRLPKRGFTPVARKEFDIVNLPAFAEFDKNEITPQDFIETGYVQKIRHGLKVLGNGDIDKALTIHAHAFSKTAKEKIEKAGGKAILIEK